MTEPKDLLYEGKAKKIFNTSNPDEVIQEFKDSLTAFNAQKKGSFQGKGPLNLKITTCIFDHLSKQGISSHFVRTLNERMILTKKLQIIPLEIVVRNVVAGSLSKRLGIEEGVPLKEPIVEFYYKNDDLGDPLLTTEHIKILEVADEQTLASLRDLGLKVNQELKTMFSEIGVDLVDFKIEAGKDPSGEIMLADEITPDSCRLWDSKTKEKYDKDRFRRDLGKIEESYQLICEKLLKRWSKQ